MNIEVPAHVQNTDHQSNGVQVKGGSNWDLSRSAVVTPIGAPVDRQPKKMADDCECDLSNLRQTAYEPKHRMPSMAPVLTINFSKDGKIIPSKDARELSKIPKNSKVVIAGHADADESNASGLAESRAKSVAVHLKRTGKNIEAIKSFGADLPLTVNLLEAERNRRVEVFVKK